MEVYEIGIFTFFDYGNQLRFGDTLTKSNNGLLNFLLKACYCFLCFQFVMIDFFRMVLILEHVTLSV
jgi:hypothetical protein